VRTYINVKDNLSMYSRKYRNKNYEINIQYIDNRTIEHFKHVDWLQEREVVGSLYRITNQ